MKLTDEQLLDLIDRYDLGETQEAILAELDSARWTPIGRIAEALGMTSAVSKIKRMERLGYVEIRRGKGGKRYVRLPVSFPPIGPDRYGIAKAAAEMNAVTREIAPRRNVRTDEEPNRMTVKTTHGKAQRLSTTEVRIDGECVVFSVSGILLDLRVEREALERFLAATKTIG